MAFRILPCPRHSARSFATVWMGPGDWRRFGQLSRASLARRHRSRRNWRMQRRRRLKRHLGMLRGLRMPLVSEPFHSPSRSPFHRRRSFLFLLLAKIEKSTGKRRLLVKPGATMCRGMAAGFRSPRCSLAESALPPFSCSFAYGELRTPGMFIGTKIRRQLRSSRNTPRKLMSRYRPTRLQSQRFRRGRAPLRRPVLTANGA